ncbi:MAG: GxxExxY protein [Candidatus Sumerlaeota bacterium]|nr:GxxExxY protein [Candidatus Sumerlaeota bacterium]
MDTSKPFAQEGYDLMNAAFEVHYEQGGGLSEEIYQECLEMELQMRSIPFRSKQEMTIYYKGRELQKRYVLDLVVFDHIIVELKAVSELASEHEAQLLNYMRISKQPVGYLINFAPHEKVEWKRFVISEFVASSNR